MRMKSTKLMLAGVVLSILAMIVLPVPALSAQVPTYQLPQNSSAPVITLDYQGNRLTRINDAPTLSILANGKVLMPQSYAHTRAYQGQISQLELQQLLDFIIRLNRIFDYDPDMVKRKLSSVRTQPLPAHFSTTVIRVNAANQEKEIRYAAVGHGPAVTETNRVRAITKRLEQLMSVVKLGGTAELTNWLNAANQELALKSSSAAPFKAEDLEDAVRREDGSVHVRFARTDGTSITSVTTDLTADGERLVTVAQDNQ